MVVISMQNQMVPSLEGEGKTGKKGKEGQLWQYSMSWNSKAVPG